MKISTTTKIQETDHRGFKPVSHMSRTKAAFETIHETSESPDCSETESTEDQSQPNFSEVNFLVYKEVQAEKALKVDLIPAKNATTDQETELKTETSTNGEAKRLIRRNAEISVDTSLVPVSNSSSMKSNTRSKAALKNGLVPSEEFFYDIADLSERLRRGAVRDRALKRRGREEVEEVLRVLEHVEEKDRSNQQKNDDSKIETASVDSSDSFRRPSALNMFYEPPILFESKGRYLGVKAPKPGHRSGTVKTHS